VEDLRVGHGVTGFAGFIVLILVLAAVGGRLLGVRQSLRRALLVGFASLVVGYIFAFLVTRRHPGQLSPLVVVAAVVATMLLTVLAELVVRPGARPRTAGLPRPWRVLRRTGQRIRRYGQLARIAGRHGLAGFFGPGPAEPGTPGQLARRLRLALEEAGPIFVKLGQVLSTRTDLLSAAVTAELSQLQDRVSAAPWPAVQALLEEELGAGVDEVFAEIDRQPVAAASLAQAYRARRPGGAPVILKIQRPGIAELVTRDLDMIRHLTRRLEARAEWARTHHVADLGRGFADALAEELDFRVEARNIAAVTAAAPLGTTVRIPTVHADISGRRLLTLDRFDGVSVRDAGPRLDETGADRRALARELLGCLLRQILVEGTFHADPHPGNVLLLSSGQLALIDFGSVGRLDIRQQAALRRLFTAVTQRDPAELYEAVTELAAAPVRDGEVLEQTLTAFMTQHLGPGMTADAAMIRDLMAVLAQAGAAFPPVIGGVFRALITLDGTLRTLAPDFDMAAESQSVARQLAGDQFAPESLRAAAERELLTLLPMLRKLPRRADRISASLAEGRLTTNLRLFSDPRDVSVITTLVNRAVLGLLGSALGLMSVILLQGRGSPGLTKGITTLQLFGYIGLFLSVTLILRVVIDILRPRR
jgi:ubiquinone biosynthesis protein